MPFVYLMSTRKSIRPTGHGLGMGAEVMAKSNHQAYYIRARKAVIRLSVRRLNFLDASSSNLKTRLSSV